MPEEEDFSCVITIPETKISTGALAEDETEAEDAMIDEFREGYYDKEYTKEARKGKIGVICFPA